MALCLSPFPLWSVKDLEVSATSSRAQHAEDDLPLWSRLFERRERVALNWAVWKVSRRRAITFVSWNLQWLTLIGHSIWVDFITETKQGMIHLQFQILAQYKSKGANRFIVPLFLQSMNSTCWESVMTTTSTPMVLLSNEMLVTSTTAFPVSASKSEDQLLSWYYLSYSQ